MSGSGALLSNLSSTKNAAAAAASQQSASTGSGGGLAAAGQQLAAGINAAFQGAKEQLADAVNTKLTNPLFQTGAKDELTQKDIYGVTNSKGINTFVDLLTGAAGGLLGGSGGGLGGLLGGNNPFSSVFSAVTGGTGGSFSFDAKEFANRALATIGGINGSTYSGLSSTLTNVISSATGISPEILTQVYTVADNTYQSYQAGNLTDARGLFNLVASITGNPALAQVFDMGAQVAVMSGIFQEAIRLGVPDAIDGMLASDQHDDVKEAALQINATYAIDSGDLTTINLFLDTLGPGRLQRDVPDAPARLLAAYRFPYQSTAGDYAALWTDLSTLLVELDPNWGRKTRDGVELYDLSVFTRASPDAQILLNLQEEYRTPLMIAGSYPTDSLKQIAKQDYPLVAL